VFEDRPAVPSKVPLLIGIMGPSGGGKTYSALRLASGITRIAGGEFAVIDTESKRALHYASDFKFRHINFAAPFSPLDYLAALEHCAKRGMTTVVVDSMSHEHEGPGGVLEWQAAEVERLSGGDAAKAENSAPGPSRQHSEHERSAVGDLVVGRLVVRRRTVTRCGDDRAIQLKSVFSALRLR
jgi:hypothetical protein